MKQAAHFLGITVQTIKNYICPGKLKTYKTPGDQHHVLASDLQHLACIRSTPSREELLEQHDRLYRDYLDTIGALLNALDTRDGIAGGHSRRVANYTCVIGGGMGLSLTSLRALELAALLHDVGKIMIDDGILGKSGKLTDQETSIVRQHPVIGERIVGEVEFLREIMGFIRHHHERFDGMGYPDGLVGEAIPLEARIIFIAEVFDCLMSDTAYRPSRDFEEILGEMEGSSGTQFDPHILGIFMDNLN
ncbi:MAG: HD domain-containing phosphohydrolase [Thermodesulfobacteriota bacterium]